ncbi:MAG: DUF4860 domain-containing protein [Oscillospiraceae bacterium]|nr:DUF4860 domain-containing protein [Oscillospiraceae bacterium]
MKKKHALGTEFLFALALLCVFALCSVLLVTIGGGVYRDIVAGMDENYALRTSLSYAATKVRQGDREGGVSLRDANGVEALVLEEPLGDRTFETWIYHKDGKLWEVFMEQGGEFDLSGGMEIMEIERFAFDWENGWLTFTAGDGEAEESLSVFPRTGR